MTPKARLRQHRLFLAACALFVLLAADYIWACHALLGTGADL